MIRKISILTNNFIGINARAWEEIAFIPTNSEPQLESDFQEVLGVKPTRCYLDNTGLIGVLLTMNKNGIIVNGNVSPEFIKGLIPDSDINVVSVNDSINAVGNDIVTNDHGAIIHEDFSKKSEKLISDALGVEVVRKTIGGIKTVGSASVVTNKGMLVNPETTDEEIDYLTNFFKVPVKIGTANYGSIFVGSCIIANSKGALVGSSTTPIEIGRIDDVL
ncbi:MAG: translation initiation factor IF-6 [Thermoplasmataceae archaeon]